MARQTYWQMVHDVMISEWGVRRPVSRCTPPIGVKSVELQRLLGQQKRLIVAAEILQKKRPQSLGRQNEISAAAPSPVPRTTTNKARQARKSASQSAVGVFSTTS